MSKADRIRRAHAEEIARLQQKKQSKKTPGWVYGLIIGVVGAIAAVVIVVLALQLTGTTLRNTISVVGSSDDDRVEIDNAVMCYFFMNNYSNYVNQYGSYLSYLGLDTSDSLKEQEYYGAEDTTWYDYFAGLAKTQVEELIITAMAAKDAGYEAEDEINSRIEKSMENIKGYADKNGYSLQKYISLCYGTGVKESDLRNALKLHYTAQTFYEHLYEGYKYTDAEIDAYFEKNAKDFMYFDTLSYTFTATYDKDATTTEKNKALADIKAEAEKLLATKDEAAFKAWVEQYLKAQEKKDTEIATALDGLANKDSKYNKDNAAAVWVYEDGRQLNDTTLIVDEKAYTCTVYMVTKLPARYEYNTVDARHILFTKDTWGSNEKAKAKAEEVFAAFQKDPTAENFAKLVKEYSEDTGSVENGGLYENITKDYMVEEFDAWIFDAARKAGDCEIVKTDYGYHIMFFEGVSDPAWKISVETAMKNEAYTAAYDEFKKEIKVTVDDKKLGKLPF